MSVDLVLTNAQIVTEEAVFRGSVAVHAGKIVDVLSGDASVDARTVIDAEGKLLLPGLVDGHVHFNQPGREHWEGYRTGSMAAAAGGVTTVIEMPLNSTPPTTTVARLAHKRDVVRTESVVDYAHWGGLVDDNLNDLSRPDRRGRRRRDHPSGRSHEQIIRTTSRSVRFSPRA